MADSNINHSSEKTTEFALMLELITAPNSAIDRIWRKGASWWLPLAAVLVANGIMWIFYFAQVDMDWFVSYSVAELEGDEQRQATERMADLSSGFFSMMAIGASTIGAILFNLVFALYLFLVNRVVGTTARSFKEWFTMIVWIGLPAVFLAVGGLINLLVSGSAEIAPEILSLTNLNGLVFHASKSDALFGFYNSLDLVYLWLIVLVAIALIKNGQGRPAAVITALLPQLLISGIALL